MAKLWVSETEGRVIDELFELSGGYGSMNEFIIARMYADARGGRIYGGTNEIMKEVIARYETGRTGIFLQRRPRFTVRRS
jgi:acyl-CoA dehydrogenase